MVSPRSTIGAADTLFLQDWHFKKGERMVASVEKEKGSVKF